MTAQLQEQWSIGSGSGGAASTSQRHILSAASFNAIFAQQQFSLDLSVTHDACGAELDLVELVRGVVSRGRAPLVAWLDGHPVR